MGRTLTLIGGGVLAAGLVLAGCGDDDERIPPEADKRTVCP